jgi:hypothetical protein
MRKAGFPPPGSSSTYGYRVPFLSLNRRASVPGARDCESPTHRYLQHMPHSLHVLVHDDSARHPEAGQGPSLLLGISWNLLRSHGQPGLELGRPRQY